MTDARSPLAPERFPAMPAIGGLALAGVETGLRYHGRPDLMLARLRPGTTVAGVFTKSATRSPAVEWSVGTLARWEESEGHACPVAIIANAGNANAFTGKAGEAAAREMASIAAHATETRSSRVLVASTGVIGEQLPTGPIRQGANAASALLSPDGWEAAAQAILTTDTFPKGAVTPFPVRPISGPCRGNCEGIWHDCAEHGNNAGLRIH